MSAADRLHPALAFHIVNGLGWKSLRPLQEAAIEPILNGEHVLLMAPTAGGKTEAAFFPLLSKCMSSVAPGLRVLYVCPLRALLNNLGPRLSTYAAWAGMRAAVWHGDTPDAEKRKIAKDPPEFLLTTPESLEIMLVSRQHDRAGMFGAVEAVVVDELHAFIGDDRGHHLLFVLDRVAEKAGRELQRVGLSATVGNTQALLTRFTAGCSRPSRVVTPPAGPPVEPDVELDWVENVANAALLLSRLHRGEKRLIFCDSRSRAEQMASELNSHDVKAFVSHGSLGREERARAERAFAEGTDCAIVSTSTLELGVDVGDLDRMIQLDAPSTVASYLQRMGRTGRRPGARRNALFLATSDEGFLRAAALERLRAEGWVEPVEEPVQPIHVVAQQILAEALEHGGLNLDRIAAIRRRSGLRGIEPESFDFLLDHLVATEFLFDDGARKCVGPATEKRYGGKNYLELYAVFAAPPLVVVKYGRTVVGEVHESTFSVRTPGPRVLSLGGRSWSVKQVDWKRRIAHVEPAGEKGRSRWLGPGRPLSFRVCRAMRAVLIDGETPARLTRRGRDKLEELRLEFDWLAEGATQIVPTVHGPWTWWTFAGARANAAIAAAFVREFDAEARSDNLCVKVTVGPTSDVATRRLTGTDPVDLAALFPTPIDEAAVATIKFNDCLPQDLLTRTLTARLSDPAAFRALLADPIELVPPRTARS